MRKTTMIFFALMAMMMMAMPAYAQGGTTPAPNHLVPIAACFGIAIAAGLAGLGQGRVGAAACEAMARNPAARPAIQLALILGLAFVESLVLFTFVVVFTIIAKS